MAFFTINGLTSYDILTLPHSTLRGRRKNEWSSACPFCKEGYDRFRFWPSVGNYFCRRCDARGFVVDAPKGHHELSIREIMDGKITSRTPEFHRWLEYNSLLQVVPVGLEYWYKALGPNFMRAVDYFGLGFCRNCMGMGPSVTIPVGYNKKVFLVKHRLLEKNIQRYVTEPSGLNAMLFNLDGILEYDKVIIAEGEKKAIRLWLEGYPAISPSNGVNGFKAYEEWKLFFVGKEVIVIFDPDAEGKKESEFVAKLLNGTSISLPGKVDDLMNSGFDIKSILGEPWGKNEE